MPDFSPNLAKNAVQAFLTSQFEKKTEKEQKQLVKAIEDNDLDKIEVLKQALEDAKEKYSKSVWIEDAAKRMARQLNFGTHISKGIHPDAKGNNVSFTASNQIPSELVGTHSINSEFIDANGNAAALPLAAFFDFQINETTKIRDLIVTDNADFIGTLHDDPQLADDYHQAFKKVLQNIIEQPVTHERNKQMLWPSNVYQTPSLDNLSYINIVPLYPSVLSFEAYQRINHLKFSDENKLARDNRFKKTVEQKPYVSLNNLAIVQLGGTKPQNVSLLMSKQGGRNYLLPSLPPTLTRYTTHFKPSKFATSIFSNALEKRVSPTLLNVFSVIKTKPNNVKVRDLRKQAMDEVLTQIFDYAHYMQNELPAGWTKDQVNLNDSEKFWLDPKRAELEGEEAWKEKRESEEWHRDIIHSYARWINSLLQKRFKDIKDGFADTEHTQWKRDMQAMIDLYERAGKGVFL